MPLSVFSLQKLVYFPVNGIYYLPSKDIFFNSLLLYAEYSDDKGVCK